MDFIPEFNDKQLDRLSEFLSNTSLLSLASLVFPNLFRIDKPNMLDLKLGLGIRLVALTKNGMEEV